MFVNDGSRDDTWKIIYDLSRKDIVYTGISLSRNRGHQNALLAFDGITRLGIKPIRMITGLGTAISCVAFALTIYALLSYFMGNVVSGWASILIVTRFLGGIQLVSLGVIGAYVGKSYLETKGRPRFIVGERTENRRNWGKTMRKAVMF